MIYKEFDAYDLKREFEKWDRDYFSIEACERIIELFEDTQFELDIIALCCDFTEYTPDELMNDYESSIGSEDVFLAYQTEYFENNDIESPSWGEVADAQEYAREILLLDAIDEANRSQTVEELANGNYLVY